MRIRTCPTLTYTSHDMHWNYSYPAYEPLSEAMLLVGLHHLLSGRDLLFQLGLLACRPSFGTSEV